LDSNPRYFCGGDFSRSMAPNEDMLDVLRSHDDGDHIEVPNLVKMFSIVALVIRANV
jgi:hypothetical protein